MNNIFRFDVNNYEFNQSSDLGVYIIHGFSNTTYETRELAAFLGDNGFHTITHNLPGHGLTPQDCNRIKYQDWLYFVKEEIAKLSSISKKIYIIGCSMGGVLALYSATIFPINACIVAGTVIKFNNPFTIKYIIPLICNIVKTRNKNLVIKNKNIKFYGYEQYPLVALNEFRKMNNYVITQLNQVKCPTLMFHSIVDKLSIKENIDIVSDNIASKNKKKIILEHAHHNMFDSNPDQHLIFNKILKFLQKN